MRRHRVGAPVAAAVFVGTAALLCAFTFEAWRDGAVGAAATFGVVAALLLVVVVGSLRLGVIVDEAAGEIALQRWGRTLRFRAEEITSIGTRRATGNQNLGTDLETVVTLRSGDQCKVPGFNWGLSDKRRARVAEAVSRLLASLRRAGATFSVDLPVIEGEGSVEPTGTQFAHRTGSARMFLFGIAAVIVAVAASSVVASGVPASVTVFMLLVSSLLVALAIRQAGGGIWVDEATGDVTVVNTVGSRALAARDIVLAGIVPIPTRYLTEHRLSVRLACGEEIVVEGLIRPFRLDPGRRSFDRVVDDLIDALRAAGSPVRLVSMEEYATSRKP